MQRTRFPLLFALAFALPGCSGEDPAAGQTASSTTSLTGTTAELSTDSDAGSESEGSTSTGEDSPEPIPVDRAQIDRYAGAWSGPVTMTPWGTIEEFPVDFAWDGDAALASETPIPETDGYFRFTFVQGEGDMWSLVEEGKLPGGPTQTYTLDPVEIDGDTSLWVYLEDPDFLSIEITVSDTELVFDTRLKGQSHATFNLGR